MSNFRTKIPLFIVLSLLSGKFLSWDHIANWLSKDSDLIPL